MSGPPLRKKSRFFSEGKSKIGSFFGKNSDKNQIPVLSTSLSDVVSTTPASSFGSSTSDTTQAASFQSTYTSFSSENNINKNNLPAQNVNFTGILHDKSTDNTQSNQLSLTAAALSNLTVRDIRCDGVYGPQGLSQSALTFLRSDRSQGVETSTVSFGNNALTGTPTVNPSTMHNHQSASPTCHSPDRKSTRLNSSHPSISYAVFCLKK